MVQQQPQILRPETLVEEFRKNGVTHVVTIPDSETNYLYELMLEQDWLDVVPVSREGETMGVGAGAECGGQDAGLPDSEYGDDGVGGFHTRDGAGRGVSAGDGGGLSRVDEAGEDAGYGGDVY